MQWPAGEKEGQKKIQTFKYLEHEESFLNKIKNNFHNKELSISEIYEKIADTTIQVIPC